MTRPRSRSMTLDDAIAVFDRSAERTRPNKQTEAWKVLRAWIFDIHESQTRYTVTEAGRAMLRDAQQSSPDRQQGE